MASLVVMLVVGPALGQSSPIAEQMFQDGRALFDAKDYAGACAKFRESNTIERAAGPLYYLGRCNEEQGKFASAWSAFLEAASIARTAGKDDAAKRASDKADGLKDKLSKVVVEVADPVEGMTVTVGDTEVGSAAWGSELPVDAGAHEVTAKADGYEPWRGAVTVPPDAGVARLTVPKLVAKPEAPPGVPKPRPAGTSPFFYVGIGSALVGVGAIVGGAVVFQGGVDEEAEVLSGTCEDENGDVGPCGPFESSKKTPGIILISGGVLFAGVGAALMIAFSGDDSEDDPEAATRRVTPIIGPAYAGLNVRF